MYLIRRDSASMVKEPISSCCTKNCFDHPRLQSRHSAQRLMYVPNEMIHGRMIPSMAASMRYRTLLHNSLCRQSHVSSHILKERLNNRGLCKLQIPVEQQLTWRLNQRRGLVALETEKRPLKSHQKYRTTFSMEQVAKLEEEFQRQQYIVAKDRFILSREIGISELQVKVWFQNRRIKWRKQQLEQHSDQFHERISNEANEGDVITKTEQE